MTVCTWGGGGGGGGGGVAAGGGGGGGGGGGRVLPTTGLYCLLILISIFFPSYPCLSIPALLGYAEV